MPSPLPVGRFRPRLSSPRSAAGSPSKSSPLSVACCCAFSPPLTPAQDFSPPPAAAPAAHDRPGSVNLSALSLQGRLGSGAFGRVFEGCYYGRRVAVKLLSLRGASSLHAELNAAGLRHPNIARLLAASPRTLVLELAGPRSLQGLLYEGDDAPLPLATRLAYARDVAEALRFLHGRDIAHLDVKPGNVVLAPDGACKLCDFGCSRRLSGETPRPAAPGGTYTHRAPELLSGGAVTSAADVYSLAVTLWQLATREAPFPGEEPHCVVYAVVARGARPSFPAGFGERGGDDPEARVRALVERGWAPRPLGRPRAGSVGVALGEIVTAARGGGGGGGDGGGGRVR
ncbi:serine/threonine-protein kinase mos [Petromyzon marinus]|uniref:non-specific serine/threonine protein kinase n=1 Tax=Petromyzon marinus TaxID=7757 RepID=A0AAJ7TVL0_PETMA|nr:proto-oncogene serine/threonine-protein kinase mos [Petromyzon marinus]